MKIDNAKFIAEAEKIYCENPSEFGFAFWKFRELIKKSKVNKVFFKGCIHLYAIKDNKLVFYWSENKSNMVIPINRLKTFDLIFAHVGYKNILKNLKHTHHIREGNALIYDDSYLIGNEDNPDYYIDSFNFNDNNDYVKAAKIINSSTSKWNMTPERIKSFTTLPVFDKSLWVFVKDTKTRKPVSVGICIYDGKISETELEWIYVHKEHQGRRLGTMLINEIIRRAVDKSKIIRVGGVADEFYIKCGFNIKTKTWLWIPKKDTKVSWWD